MNEATIIKAGDWSIRINSTDPYQSFTQADPLRQPTRQATFIGAILAFVFIIIGLIGNIILITAILSVKKLRSNIINIFIVSVSDEIRDGEEREREKWSFNDLSQPHSSFTRCWTVSDKALVISTRKWVFRSAGDIQEHSAVHLEKKDSYFGKQPTSLWQCIRRW